MRNVYRVWDALAVDFLLDKGVAVPYTVSKLANLSISGEVAMATKSISSTEAQNNFGRVLDDVTHNRTRYVIARRGVPQAIVLSFEDFTQMLGDASERKKLGAILKDIRPEYHLGQVVDPSTTVK